jgi:hypothetical protein
MKRYQLQAHVPAESINRVMATAVEKGVANFSVHDNRGGTGMWLVVFEEMRRKDVRDIVGPGIHVEPV